jgi:hypothetical protein
MSMDGMPTMTPQHARPRDEYARRWPLLLIASPAAVAVWSGWVGLGSMCGFGLVHPLPGIVPGFQINTAITLPIGVESYGAYALYAWLSSRAGEKARTFARRSAVGALALGCLGQVAFHLLAASGLTRAPVPVVVLVACLPVVTLSFAAALTHLLHADTKAAEEATAEAERSAREAAEKAAESAAAKAARSAALSAAASAAAVPPGEPGTVPPAVPESVPPAVPRPKVARIDKSPEAERARADYRKSARQGNLLSARALGDKYGKSKTWGASRIREVGSGPHLAAKAG